MMVDVPIRRDPRSQRRRYLLRGGGVAALVAIGVLALCQVKPAAPSVEASSLWIDTVRRGPLLVQVHGSGTLVPEDIHWVAAASDGRIERVLVQPGTRVSAESVLVEISNPELQQSAREAELDLTAALAELEQKTREIDSALLNQEAVVAAANADYDEARLRAATDGELAAAGLTSKITLQFSQGREKQLAVKAAVEDRRLKIARDGRQGLIAASRSKVERLRALVALKHQQIEGLHVRAGSAGIVQQVPAEPGARVTAGTNLARVAAPEPLKAAIQVSEVQASQMALGQPVDVDVHVGMVRGTVARVDPTVQNGSVTVDVQLPRSLPNGVRPDLSVDAVVNIDRVTDAIFVGRPVQAEGHGAVTLFRVDANGEATRRKVRVGRASYNAIEVLGGLGPGDRVILSDMSAYDRYDRIRVRE
jgi:HlyD family secretion protein